MKIVLELTKAQANTLREAVRYYTDDAENSGQPDAVAARLLDKIDEALED